jgi:hypothetical protein
MEDIRFVVFVVAGLLVAGLFLLCCVLVLFDEEVHWQDGAQPVRAQDRDKAP